MKPIELENVMLCAVSSVAIDQTVAALEKSCRHIRFGDVVLLSDVDPALTSASPIRWQAIYPIKSKEAYSRFMIKELGQYVTRPFVLVVQWDGFVLDHCRWNPAFLDYDYIGAVWPQFKDGMTMGNGGFSLRSRRLLEVLSRDEFTPFHPEDVAICRNWRRQLEDQYSISFAPNALASTFSAERVADLRETFGFHGFYNMPDVLPIAEMHEVVASLPDRVLHGLDGADFIIRLAMRGHVGLAWRLMGRRLWSSPWNWRQVRLIYAVACCSVQPSLRLSRHLVRE